MQLKALVKWLLIISALLSVFSIFGLIIAPTASASQAEIEDCRSGERSPEEMGYSGLTCNDMEDGVKWNQLLMNYVKVLGCMTCVPSALILGGNIPIHQAPQIRMVKISLKMQQLDDVNQQLNAARVLLKKFRKISILTANQPYFEPNQGFENLNRLVNLLRQDIKRNYHL